MSLLKQCTHKPRGYKQYGKTRVTEFNHTLDTFLQNLNDFTMQFNTTSLTVLAELRNVQEKINEANSPETDLPSYTSFEPRSEFTNTTRQTETDRSSQSLAEINRTFVQLNKILESNFQNKIHIKRDYKLNNKSNLDTWNDLLYSELASNDLKEILTHPEKFENNDSEKSIKMKTLVQ